MTRKMILLNPGPTNVSDAVLRAASGPLVCHREPEYFNLQDQVRERLLRVLDLDPSVWTAVLISGSGTSAVEAMILAGAPVRKTLLISDNGIYGDRIAGMARAHGIPVEVAKQTWGEATDPAFLAEYCAGRDDLGAIAVIHHETTTGVLNPVAEVGRVAREHGLAMLVDSVSGLGGDLLDLEEAGVDLCACTGGKNFQGLPGISFVYARREKLRAAREWSPHSVYLDLVNLGDTQDRRGTPFTPAVPLVRALNQALVELEEETVAGRVERYSQAARFLRDGYERIGFEHWLPEATPKSNCLTTLRLPEGRAYADLHDTLKNEGFVIYGGQGRLEEEAFRIANMGNVDRNDYERLLGVLERWAER